MSDDDSQPRHVPARRTRKRFTNVQLTMLEQLFHQNSHPSREDREAVAAAGGMEIKSVTIWFQNKRQTERKSLAASQQSVQTLPPVLHNGGTMHTFSVHNPLVPSTSNPSSTNNISTRPSLDRVASRAELLTTTPRKPYPDPSRPPWDNMPSSPITGPISPPQIDYNPHPRQKKTLEWACAAARIADRERERHSSAGADLMGSASQLPSYAYGPNEAAHGVSTTTTTGASKRSQHYQRERRHSHRDSYHPHPHHHHLHHHHHHHHSSSKPDTYNGGPAGASTKRRSQHKPSTLQQHATLPAILPSSIYGPSTPISPPGTEHEPTFHTGHHHNHHHHGTPTALRRAHSLSRAYSSCSVDSSLSTTTSLSAISTSSSSMTATELEDNVSDYQDQLDDHDQDIEDDDDAEEESYTRYAHTHSHPRDRERERDRDRKRKITSARRTPYDIDIDQDDDEYRYPQDDQDEEEEDGDTEHEAITPPNAYNYWSKPPQYVQSHHAQARMSSTRNGHPLPRALAVGRSSGSASGSGSGGAAGGGSGSRSFMGMNLGIHSLATAAGLLESSASASSSGSSHHHSTSRSPPPHAHSHRPAHPLTRHHTHNTLSPILTNTNTSAPSATSSSSSPSSACSPLVSMSTSLRTRSGSKSDTPAPPPTTATTATTASVSGSASPTSVPESSSGGSVASRVASPIGLEEGKASGVSLSAEAGKLKEKEKDDDMLKAALVLCGLGKRP